MLQLYSSVNERSVIDVSLYCLSFVISHIECIVSPVFINRGEAKTFLNNIKKLGAEQLLQGC